MAHLRAKPTVGPGDHTLAAYQIGILYETLCHQLRVLDEIRGGGHEETGGRSCNITSPAEQPSGADGPQHTLFGKRVPLYSVGRRSPGAFGVFYHQRVMA